VVKIRLKRMGATKRPVYRIVVADSRSPRDGRFIETIGFYDPLHDPAVVRIDEEKARTWMRKGARPSDSARELLVRQGILAATPRPARASRAETPAAPAPAVAAALPEPVAAHAAQPEAAADESDTLVAAAESEEAAPPAVEETES